MNRKTSKIIQNSGFKNLIIIAGVMIAKTIILPILLVLFLSIICIQPILF